MSESKTTNLSKSVQHYCGVDWKSDTDIQTTLIHIGSTPSQSHKKSHKKSSLWSNVLHKGP